MTIKETVRNKAMKLQDIREKTIDELKSLVIDLKKELFNLRLQKSTNKLENPASIATTKRTIAQVKTVIKEKASNEGAAEVENA